MADYKIQIGTELDTKDIDSKIKNYKAKPIEVKTKLDTSNIDKELAGYKAKDSIEVGVKLNTTGIAKKIGDYKPKIPVTLRAELNTEDIDSAISAYASKNKKVTIGVQLNTKDIQAEIQSYAAKTNPVIEVDAKLNDKAIDTAIQNYKQKQRIKVALALNAADIEEKIREYEARSPLRVKVKINKTDINKQLSEYDDADAHITVKAKLDNGAISEAIRNYKAKTPIKVDLELDKTDIDNKISAYKSKPPVEITAKLKLNVNDINSQLQKYKLTVPIKLNVKRLDTKSLEEKIKTYNAKSSIKVGVQLDSKSISEQIAKLPKLNTPIEVGVKLDEDKINADIALFKPKATLGIQPDLILENVEDQIRAYVPKAKIKVNVELNSADIQELTTRKTDRAYNTVSGGSYVSSAIQELKEVDITIKATKNQITNLGKALKAVGFNNSSVKSITNDFKELGVTVTKVTSKLNSDGSVRLTVKGLDQFKDAVTYVNNIGSDGKLGAWSETVSRDVNKVTENFNRLKSLAKDIGNLKIDIFKSDDANEVKRMTDELSRLQKEYNELFAGTQGGLNGNQINQLNNIAKNAEGALSKLKKEYAETRAELAKGIKGNFSGYDAQVQLLVEKFKMLSVETPMVEAGIDRVKQALLDMKNASDDDSLIKAEQRYQDELRETEAQLLKNQSIERQDNYEENFATKKEAAMIKLNGLFDNGSQAAKRFGSEAKMLRTELDKVGNTAGVDKVTRKISNLEKKVRDSNLQTRTWGTRLKEQFSKYTQYLSIASVFMYGMQAARSMFEQVKAIDSAMTELKKVTDETDAAYDRFLGNAASKAKEIGTTIDGLVSSTADFARLGYGFEDAQGLAEVANIYAVVGDEIEGVEGATESLISTMAAFKDETSEISNTDFAMDIVDKFNEIGNNFAISSGGIGEAMERSASSMKAANNTIDETIALITAANTVVQNPDAVGTAFKTISMRMKIHCPQ